MKRRHSFLLIMVVCGVGPAACGSDGRADTSPTTSSVTTTEGSAGTTTTASTATSSTEGSATSTTGPKPLTIDPTWVAYTDDFFVWGVASDDVLNVRQAPGASKPIVATLGPGQRGIRRFDVTEQVRGGTWGVVEVPGGAGWVNLAFLRPAGSRPPRTEGVVDPRTETAADDVQALLGAGEYESLAGFVDPDRGLTISVHAYVADDAVVLSPEQVAGAGDDRTQYLWGYTDGEGAPIESTIARRFLAIAGDTGLTSTDAIGFDVVLGSGNSINNVAERFPGAHVVEYHFEGTSLYADFDWSSVRFVFDTESPAPTGRPALLAIVQDTWTI